MVESTLPTPNQIQLGLPRHIPCVSIINDLPKQTHTITTYQSIYASNIHCITLLRWNRNKKVSSPYSAPPPNRLVPTLYLNAKLMGESRNLQETYTTDCVSRIDYLRHTIDKTTYSIFTKFNTQSAEPPLKSVISNLLTCISEITHS
jgi:hypothetical protein